MQQRRGQKQDLPKPLRPGEIGFATDSRQIYIGADTTDAVSDIYNKTGNFEKTASAQSTTASIANVQMIKFIVPHKVYDKGAFDGVTDSVSWTPATDAAASSTANEYGRLGKVFTNISPLCISCYMLFVFLCPKSDLELFVVFHVISPVFVIGLSYYR